MKIHVSFKLTQYLINTFKMRFLLINCLKYAQQCQNRIFKKMCQATTVPYSVMWISPRYYVNIHKYKYGESPNTRCLKTLLALLLSEFKNRYVKANINL